MAQVQLRKKQVNIKVAYWGAPGAGKQASFAALRREVPGATPLNEVDLDGERAMYFSLLPGWLERIRGYRVNLQLFLTPPEGFWEAAPHRLVLEGVDACVLVVDSTPRGCEQAERALALLRQNLAALGEDLAALPLVPQWNRRDAGDALPVADLRARLGLGEEPGVESVATTGRGVLDALREVSERAAAALHDKLD